ncbi:MAG: DUF4185 domain-containing protein [Mycobacteriaceae bacterium]
MSSANRAVAHVGRVGALAVTLGIGAAVAVGTPVAWADTSDRGSGPNTQTSVGATASGSTSPDAPRRGARPPASTRNTSRPSSPQVADTAPTDIPAVPRLAPARPTPEQPPTNRPASNEAPAPAAAVAATAPVPVNTSGSVAAPLARVAPAAAATPAPVAVVAPAASAVAAVTALPIRTVPVIAPIAVATVPPSAAAVPAGSLAGLASGLLSAVGLGPLAGSNLPGGPVDTPALWALLGWTRRELGRSRSAAAGTALPSATVATAAVVTPPGTLPSTPIGWVTGQRNTAFPGALWTQTNNTAWANVYGTDLGIMWFNGDNQLTQLAFGDTFSGANMSGNWRSNVLLLSNDRQLNNGLSLINTGPAYQFIPAAPGQVFFIGSEVTNIPTSAVYANNTNYVNYMSVKSWDTPGRWTTNYSAISQYNPATDKWVLQKNTVRPAGYFRSSTSYQAGDQNFQQMAYVLQPETKVAPGDTRYVYAFGTPAGRAGSAYLSRVPEGSITDLKQYQYWDGSTWVSDQAKAAPVIGDSTKSTGPLGRLIDLANDPNFLGGRMAGFTGAKTGGNVSEMSIQYNDYLNKYVVLYGNGSNNVILRTADSPEGPWSDPVTIATSVQYPGLYAPMIHPLSGTGMLTDGTNPDISNLYWNMSIWGNYNVVLMKTDLSPLKVTTV